MSLTFRLIGILRRIKNTIRNKTNLKSFKKAIYITKFAIFKLIFCFISKKTNSYTGSSVNGE